MLVTIYSVIKGYTDNNIWATPNARYLDVSDLLKKSSINHQLSSSIVQNIYI